MKPLFIVILFTLLIGVSSVTNSTEINSIKIQSQSCSLHVEYVNINGEIWKLTYDDDGVLIFKEKVFD